MQIAIIIPCYNEGERLRQTLHSLDTQLAALKQQLPGIDQIAVVVIDDGSRDRVIIEPWNAEVVHCFLIRHPINLGQGAALQTGLNFAAKQLQADYFVTMDSDGQHDPVSIPHFLNYLRKNELNIVFGNRFQTHLSPHLPTSRKLLLRLACIFERFLTGLDLGDAHNGFRVFDRKVALDLELKQNRMAHATEFKQIVAEKKHRYGELPTPIAYSAETMGKGQRNLGSMFILKDLIKTYLFNG